MFCARMEGGQHCISKTAIVDVLEIDDCMFLGEEGWEFSELQSCERDIFHHLEIRLDDVIEDQTGEISFEGDMPIANHIDEGLELAGEHHRTCHDLLPTVENDRSRVVEILGGGCSALRQPPRS